MIFPYPYFNFPYYHRPSRYGYYYPHSYTSTQKGTSVEDTNPIKNVGASIACPKYPHTKNFRGFLWGRAQWCHESRVFPQEGCPYRGVYTKKRNLHKWGFSFISDFWFKYIFWRYFACMSYLVFVPRRRKRWGVVYGSYFVIAIVIIVSHSPSQEKPRDGYPRTLVLIP